MWKFSLILSVFLGSFWASKLGAKNILIFSVLLWSIATYVTPFLAQSFVALVICRIVLGFAEGLGLPTIFHLFAHNIAVEERSRAFSYLIAAGSVGQTVASVVSVSFLLLVWNLEQLKVVYVFLFIKYALKLAFYYADRTSTVLISI